MHAYGDKLDFWDMFGFLKNREAREVGDLELIKKHNDFSPRFIIGF